MRSYGFYPSQNARHPYTDTDPSHRYRHSYTLTQTHRNTHRDNTQDTPTHRYNPCPPTDTHMETHADTSTHACRYTCLYTLNFKPSLQTPLPSCSNLESTLLPMFAAEMLFWALSLQHLPCECLRLFFVWLPVS